MSDVTIVEAFDDHAFDLSPRLRETDRRELEATCGDKPVIEILLEAVEISSHRWAAIRNGEVQVLFGAADIFDDGTVGSIWLLASDDISNWRKDFMRLSREYVARMHEDLMILTNYVDDRNYTSQAWLRRLGFHPGMQEKFRGHSFTQYTSVRS